MRSFVLVTALFLCSLSWITASASHFQTVEVQLGEEVTLQCSNISTYPTQTEWFKVVNRTKPSCVSAMYGSQGKVSFCDGFQNGNFNMNSNITFVFLKIKRVDSSDVGLYFCGFYMNKHTAVSSAVELRIQGAETNEGEDFKTQKQPERERLTHLISIILGGLIGLLTVVVIILIVKIRKLQTVAERQPESNKNMSSDDLNYAALNFKKKAKRSCRPLTQRELEPHVVYAATR